MPGNDTVVESVNLRTLISLAKAVGTGKGVGKRFDYDAIRNELTKMGDNRIAVTRGRVKQAMASHDLKGTGVIHGPQISKCIEMLDARADTNVGVVPDSYPRLYVFRTVKPKATQAETPEKPAES